MENENKDKIIKWCLIIGGIIAYAIIGTLIINEMFFKHTEALVYVTKTGECYHSFGCHYLKSIRKIGLEQAKSAGYRACSFCNGTPNGTITVNNYLASFLILALGTAIIWFIVLYIRSKDQSSNQQTKAIQSTKLNNLNEKNQYSNKIPGILSLDDLNPIELPKLDYDDGYSEFFYKKQGKSHYDMRELNLTKFHTLALLREVMQNNKRWYDLNTEQNIKVYYNYRYNLLYIDDNNTIYCYKNVPQSVFMAMQLNESPIEYFNTIIKQFEYNEFEKEKIFSPIEKSLQSNPNSINEILPNTQSLNIPKENSHISKDEIPAKSENLEDEIESKSVEQLIYDFGTSLRAFPLKNLYNLIPEDLPIEDIQKLALGIQIFIKQPQNDIDTYTLFDIKTRRFKEFQVVDEVDRFADYDEYEEDEFADYKDYLDYIEKEKEIRTPQLHSSSQLAQLLINSSIGDVIEQKYIIFCKY